MKIGILTQPLETNYGGLLQAFALQVVLKRMGHEVLTVDLPIRRTFYRDCKGIIGRLVLKYLFRRKDIDNILPLKPTKSELEIITQHTNKFIKKNIQTTDRIPLVENITALEKYNFDAYIVGSDQVWRPCYSPGITTFFLDFLSEEKKTKRIAYAASFGVDSWEYKSNLTEKCRILAQKFDAISVREDSGIQLCKKYLNVNAKHLIDPTMLLSQEDYIDLVKKDNAIKLKKEKTLILYVLDSTPTKKAITEKIQNQLGLTISLVMPKSKYSKQACKNIDDCVFPPVTEWLRGFIDSEFVLTDSFHGTGLSIIFNKPFIVIGNKERGLSRFSSLLKMFGLENRLISSLDDLTTELMETPIDFKKVNQIRKEQQSKAFDFIKKALKS